MHKARKIRKTGELLSSVNILNNRRYYRADYFACDVLMDLENAIYNSGISEQEQRVLKLLYIDDLSKVDIADIIGVSKQRVSTIDRSLKIKIGEVLY